MQELTVKQIEDVSGGISAGEAIGSYWAAAACCPTPITVGAALVATVITLLL